MLMPIDSWDDYVDGVIDEFEIPIELFNRLQDYRATLTQEQLDPLRDCVVTCPCDVEDSDVQLVKIRSQAFWDEFGESGEFGRIFLFNG